MAQFGDPSIKPVLGFYLKHDHEEKVTGKPISCLHGCRQIISLLMSEKLLKSNFTFK
jgi:hypothetical protein